jgi:hypothetical protein
MDVAGTISAVTAAIGFARELNSVDGQVDQAALKLKVAELTTALADAKLGMVEVAEQLRAKDKEIADLKERLRYRAENLIDHHGFRYAQVDGQPKGLPYCPVCEHKGLYVKLAQDRNTKGYPYKCPSCKADFGYNGIHKG